MLNKKLMTVLAVGLIGVALMGAYNRPYRWWNALLMPLNVEDMNEQPSFKPFHDAESLRDFAPGAVSRESYDPSPQKLEIMTLDPKWAEFKNPVAYTDDSIKKGEELYTVYCWPCHGEGMSPDPTKYSPVKAGMLPGETEARWQLPAADINLVKNYNDQHIYAVISNGSAIMKRMSYSLSPEERWHVVNYVRSLANAQTN